jgi:hypothetical protein
MVFLDNKASGANREKAKGYLTRALQIRESKTPGHSQCNGTYPIQPLDVELTAGSSSPKFFFP